MVSEERRVIVVARPTGTAQGTQFGIFADGRSIAGSAIQSGSPCSSYPRGSSSCRLEGAVMALSSSPFITQPLASLGCVYAPVRHDKTTYIRPNIIAKTGMASALFI